MIRARDRRAVPWRRATEPRVLWPAALVVAVALLVAVRGRLDKAHVALVLLLVVLGASAGGGWALGLAVAGAAFLAFDYFLLPPYGTLAIADPRDWFVLVAFLVTSVVAARLLSAAREEARLARARAAEVDRLAALGARALTGPRARDAAAAVAAAIRDTVGVDACAVWAVGATPDAPDALRLLADTAAPNDEPLGPPPIDAALAARERTVVAQRADGTTRVARVAGPSLLRALAPLDPAELRAVSVPLAAAERQDDADDPGAADRVVGGRLVGVLRIAAAHGLRVPPERWRYLDALAAYAALAADRERLAGAAERAAALEDAARAKDAVLAAVSHDLRTPLTSIKAHAQALRTARDGADAGEHAATIEAEADRLARLVGDLLDLSRLQAGAMSAAPDVVAIDDLLDVVLQRVDGALGTPDGGGRVLDVVLPPGAPLLVARFDVGQTARALVNLVENAHKYAPPATPIALVVREAPGECGPDRRGLTTPRLCIDVCDRGPGVSAAERERIFAPFYRAPGARVDAGGAGLGLAIARGLAERQGGTLTYAPRDGGGSVFTLCVPGAVLDAGAFDAAPPADVPGPARGRS